ncbi:helix-turn-helix transcriptional regulator [Paenibacillus puerhi]|uniref:helix-turn-helix transcriptional regulator n=1 Tax=Paenibacillus puerhi TaxID=2692622 RepID=UPI00135B1B76|nr:AraC family transcriptional regulator [Paenibacillus puerhi]
MGVTVWNSKNCSLHYINIGSQLASGVSLPPAILQGIVVKVHFPDTIAQLTDPSLIAYEHIKRIIEKDFSLSIRIEKLAGSYSISPSYLRKLFLERVGLAQKKYLELVRIQHAIRYLAFSDMPIYVIAKECGYLNPFHFSKMFHKVHNISPSAYREKHQIRSR